jgi:ubiquinone/menaquinone biosynthesis C-methylase UbiE
MEIEDAETKVKSFYEGQGWSTNDHGNTTDAQLFEDLRPIAQDYVRACRRKVLSFLPPRGDRILDAASGPIQYPEYLEYSSGFKKRVCVDISQIALDEAKKKLGDKGEFHCTSLLNLPFEDSSFDAVLSLHTIYHIDQDNQEQAVRELLRVSKPNTPVIIIYSNPDRLLAKAKRFFSKTTPGDKSAPLYFYSHPLNWWRTFEDGASVEIFNWRSLTAKDAGRLIPNNILGKFCLRSLLKFENIFSKSSASLGAYPLIVLKKKI